MRRQGWRVRNPSKIYAAPHTNGACLCPRRLLNRCSIRFIMPDNSALSRWEPEATRLIRRSTKAPVEAARHAPPHSETSDTVARPESSPGKCQSIAANPIRDAAAAPPAHTQLVTVLSRPLRISNVLGSVAESWPATNSRCSRYSGSPASQHLVGGAADRGDVGVDHFRQPPA